MLKQLNESRIWDAVWNAESDGSREHVLHLLWLPYGLEQAIIFLPFGFFFYLLFFLA